MRRFWIPAFIVMPAGSLAAGLAAGQAAKSLSKDPANPEAGRAMAGDRIGDVAPGGDS